MREARLIKTAEIPLDDIDASARLRPVNDASVEALMASIETLGRMKDEIHVRKVAHQDNRLVLIAGGHRLEAAKRLGWETIAAKVWDCADDWARLLEIDDNLAHGELSTIELSVFLVERKRVYEKLYPETKQGGNRGNQHTGGRQNDIMSFCQSTAEKRSLTTRQIERYIKAGERLSNLEIRDLYQINPSQADLLALAEVDNVAERKLYMDSVLKGEAKNLKKAISQARPKDKLSEKEQDERDLSGLNEAFKRASMRTKRAFVEENSEELGALLKDLWSKDIEAAQ